MRRLKFRTACLGFAILLGCASIVSAGTTYVYETSYNGTYYYGAGTMWHTGWESQTTPGSDERVTTLIANLADYPKAVANIPRGEDYVNSLRAAQTYLIAVTMANQGAINAVQNVYASNTALSGVGGTLAAMNAGAAAVLRSSAQTYNAKAAADIATWTSKAHGRQQEYSSPVSPLPSPETKAPVTRADLPADNTIAKNSNGIKPSAYDYSVCATDNGYYGYWSGNTFVHASWDSAECQNGMCRCYRFVTR